MSQLSASGMNQWETKLAVGKSIPSDILTYLKNQAQNLREKFMNAESRFTLTGLTNSNHSKLETMEQEIKDQREALETLAKVLAPMLKNYLKKGKLTEKEKRKLRIILEHET